MSQGEDHFRQRVLRPVERGVEGIMLQAEFAQGEPSGLLERG
ncbi:hypothetical protein [Stigmatella aurantiaca]|nr:hypothetical protein [Stigmatella aurantiaca]